jgi:hypothetical protein
MGVVGENTVLVDGVVSGTWRWSDGRVTIAPFDGFPSEVEDERRRLETWLASPD